MNEAYLYNGAQGGGSPFHQPRKGHINARPKNLVIDPRTGARLGYRLRDGSFQKASSFMGKGSEYLKDERAFRIAMAKADGSFDRKREAYNRAATDTEMDENGNILRKAKENSSQTPVKRPAPELPAQVPAQVPQKTPAPAAPSNPDPITEPATPGDSQGPASLAPGQPKAPLPRPGNEALIAAAPGLPAQQAAAASMNVPPMRRTTRIPQGPAGTVPGRRRPFPDEGEALA